jgi:hypothetical protein
MAKKRSFMEAFHKFLQDHGFERKPVKAARKRVKKAAKKRPARRAKKAAKRKR